MTERKRTQCRTCLEDIYDGARKCIECGSYQDWRRYIGLSNTSLSLIIALLSVLSLFITVVDNAFIEDENISLSILGASGNHLKLAISNSGEKGAVISPDALFLTPDRRELSGLKILNSSEEPTTDLVVGPSEIKIFTVTFGRDVGYRFNPMNKDKKCGISIDVVNLSGKHRWVSDDLACGFSKEF